MKDRPEAEAARVILGLDPGVHIMGYAVIAISASTPTVAKLGVIQLSKAGDSALALGEIFDAVTAIMDEFHPDEVAIETPFYGKNVQVMLKLGRAQGVAMVAALHRRAPVFEYAPRKVKKAVTGNGNASKEQVAALLVRQLWIDAPPRYLDETDALSIALCHYYQRTNAGSKSKNRTWKDFVRNHPDRLSRKE